MRGGVGERWFIDHYSSKLLSKWLQTVLSREIYFPGFFLFQKSSTDVEDGHKIIKCLEKCPGIVKSVGVMIHELWWVFTYPCSLFTSLHFFLFHHYLNFIYFWSVPSRRKAAYCWCIFFLKAKRVRGWWGIFCLQKTRLWAFLQGKFIKSSWLNFGLYLLQGFFFMFVEKKIYLCNVREWVNMCNV